MDWATVIAAVIAAILSGCTLYFTNKNNKDTLEYKKVNDKRINEIAEKKIDADLIAKARIKWIESVREQTTELSKNFNLFIQEIQNTTNYTKQHKQINTLKNNVLGSLDGLILYFNGNQNNDTEKVIDIISELQGIDHPSLKSDSYRTINENYIHGIQNNDKKDEKITKVLRSYQGGLFDLDNVISERQLHRKATTDLAALTQLSEPLTRYMGLIQDTISVYLKIEWDKAKQGK